MEKVINRGIWIVILFGVSYGVFQLTQEMQRYNSIREVYLPLFGKLRTFSPGVDPTKYYVRCMVNEPMNLQLQYSLPTGTQFQCRSLSFGSAFRAVINSSVANTPPARVVGNCQFEIRLSSNGHAYIKESNNGSGRSGGCDYEVAKFLSDHWHKLEIEVAGSDETEKFDLNEVATLVKISIPAPLLEKAKQDSDGRLARQLGTPLTI